VCSYPSVQDKNIFLQFENDFFDNGDSLLPLSYIGNDRWELIISADEVPSANVRYRYCLKDSATGDVVFETRARESKLNFKRFSYFVIKDRFVDDEYGYRLWDSSLFAGIIFHRDKSLSSRFLFPSAGKHILEFRVRYVSTGHNLSIGITGNIPELGMWNEDKALKLNDYNFPEWKLAVNIKESQRVEYKYVIVNNITGKIVSWEEGRNRVLEIDNSSDTFHCIINDNTVKFENYTFRGAGVSIPVFSLKTKSSFGIGDFTDLKLLTDWAVKTRLKLIQILPVNDTTAYYSYLDSYPYNTISVFALNPAYLNIFKMGKLKAKKNRMKFEKLQKELNENYHVDYPKVLKLKLEYAKQLFSEHRDIINGDRDFALFVKKNKKWLQPYAAFCYLRDSNGTVDFKKWGDYSEYKKYRISRLVSEKSEVYPEIQFWYFVQYHLHRQLKEAGDYAENHGVALKGDLPIGVGRFSVETWSSPELFNFDGQAGAPPDKFAVDGQNWGFPTYNWDTMAKDDYSWWKNRLKKMSAYFDAFRIDHILGFFRIWEIPYSAVHGILGHFRPALPYSREELQGYGIWPDTERLCKPYIRGHFLRDIFGEEADKVRKRYLHETELNEFELKEEVNTQRKIYDHFVKNNDPDNLSEEDTFIMSGLLKLAAEVVLMPDSDKMESFHPRVGMNSTYSFMELDSELKNALDSLYENYFYHRHEELWRDEALKKLPGLINATKMLVCGEDLGMIPSVVPEVMQQLNILSLEVQRMPKDLDVEYSDPKTAPYLSVCTTSTHDTSTLRGWWEENRELIQRYYNHQLGFQGEAPYFAEPWVCQEIINQHLQSPAMWAVFPIQDVLAINGEIRSNDTHNERINVPADPRHYWKYRMHLFIEDLIDADDLNRTLNLIVKNSGR
jgi:4-alpha-glucanotransferase